MFKIGLKTEAGVRAEEGQRALEQPNKGMAVYDYGPPSMTQNKEGVGEQCRPRPINRRAGPKAAGC